MASTTAKPTAAAAARRKSSKAPLMVTLKLSSEILQRFAPPTPVKKEESPSKDSSSTTSIPQLVPASSNGDNPTESTSNTPVANGTPVPSSMPPPTEGVKKKGVKRTAAALGPDGLPKPRGKPGPKKKARLEDGTIDHSSSAPRTGTTGAHKLGPKANQGAINAGLRALDRSGKPCRKWAKGSFKLKSFTGVLWEIPRWTAPPKTTGQPNSEESTSGGSSKENKDNSQIESERSNNGLDAEMSNLVSSPAPSLPQTTLPVTETPTPPQAMPAVPTVTASA